MLKKVKKEGREFGVVYLHVDLKFKDHLYQIKAPGGKTFNLKRERAGSDVHLLELPLDKFNSVFTNGKYQYKLVVDPGARGRGIRTPGKQVKAKAKPAPEVVAKPAPKPEPKPKASVPKPARALTKADPKAGTKAAPKAETKAGAKVETKAEEKALTKAVEKAAGKGKPKEKAKTSRGTKGGQPIPDDGKTVASQSDPVVFVVSGKFPAYVELVTPARGATGASRKPKISWTVDGKAEAYALTIVEHATGKEVVDQDITKGMTSFTVPAGKALKAKTKYLLQLEAENTKARRVTILVTAFTTGA